MSSSALYDLDIKGLGFFPTFDELPYDHGYGDGFYQETATGVLVPGRHWCFLAEVTQCEPWIRPMYWAKDTKGQNVHIAFHTRDRSPNIALECEVGDTLAIMYASSHVFADGSIGIRVEDHNSVKVFHCDLEAILETGTLLNMNDASCRTCGKSATSSCKLCKMKYCSKECQVSDWKARHKKECAFGQSFCKWKSFDWMDFQGLRSL